MFRMTQEAQEALADDEAERRMVEREGEIRAWCATNPSRKERAGVVSYLCGLHPLTREPYHSPEDVLSWLARAEEFGAKPMLGAATLIDVLRIRKVPNAIFRKRFIELHEAGRITSTEVATRIGLCRSSGGAINVERRLGLKVTNQPHWKTRTLALFMPYEWGVRLADALDIQYVDCGV